jgi:CHAT domain-containing protein/tetratricopeptide (TPR) repeat protein
LFVLVVACHAGLRTPRRALAAVATRSGDAAIRVVRTEGQEPESNCAQGNTRLLNPGEVVRREIAGGEKHIFCLPLNQGQYAHLVVVQQGADLEVKLAGPDGKAIVLMDSPNGQHGPEVVSLVAKAKGEHKLELLSNNSRGMAGSYELRLDGPREPLPADLERAAAVSAFVEGQLLRSEGTEKSRLAAIDRYKKARELWGALGDRQVEAYALCNIGRTFKALGKPEEALQRLNQALLILGEEKDLLGQAFMLNELGSVYRDLGSDDAKVPNPEKALDVYQQSLKLRREAGDRWSQAQSLNNIGLIYARMSDFNKALEYYAQALSLWRAVGDRNLELNTLNNIAGVSDELGDPQQALGKYEQSLKFWQEVGDSRLAAIASNNIAKIYDTWGDSQKALALYEQALLLHQQEKNLAGEAQVLDNLGMLYVGLGDARQAMESFDKALPIREKVKEQRGLALTQHNKAVALALQGEFREALKFYEKARAIREKERDKSGLALTLAGIGSAYASLGETEKALDYYRQSLDAQKEVGNLRGQAIVINRLGYAYTQMGDLVKASSHFEQALDLWDRVGDKQGKAMSLYGLAQVASGRNNLDTARNHIEEAISIVESLRAKVNSQQLRITYLAAKLNYYELAIDVRMQLYERNSSMEHLEAAFNLSERSRSRSLLELLAEMGSGIRGDGDPERLKRMNQLEGYLNAVSEKLVNLRSTKPRSEKDPLLATQIESLRIKQIESLKAEYEQLLNQQDKLRADIRAQSPRYAQLMLSQPLRLSEVQQLLDGETVLLEYSLGDKSSYVWAVTRTSITGRRLMGREAIEQVARRLKDLMSSPPHMRPNELPVQFEARLNEAEREYRQQAAELSKLVLEPIASNFGNRYLLIAPDGLLRFIPFGALPKPDAPEQRADAVARGREPLLMVDKYVIAYQPSASVMAMLRAYRRRPADKLVAIFADPVFDSNDERVRLAARRKQSGVRRQGSRAPEEQARRASPDSTSRNLMDGEPALERLSSSLREANDIMKLVPRGSGMQVIGFEASRAAAMRHDLGRYKIVHFATHGLLDDENPELSSLVFSLVDEQGQHQDGYLLLHDVYNLSLPVEMVVLSACRTGVGKEAKGEGLIGLTRGFMHAGSARVVSSLWKIDTDDTAELMRMFYRHMLKGNLPPAAALQAAQIEMRKLNRNAPYRWAGFILQGEWR